jgi:hypothetical protein
MKLLTLSFLFVFTIILNTNANNTEPQEKVLTELNSDDNVQGSVKIINDTKEDLRIHTGKGIVKLNHRGGSTSVSCDTGRKISLSDGSKATKLLFKIESSMCGETVKLSDYM